MNIQNENETNAQTLSAPSVLPPSISPSPGRPLSRLSVLSERQLEHVHAWIKECVPSRKISELCSKEFQKEIPHMTFVRYAHRFEPFRHLNGLNDSKEAAKEISQYAATGNPSFSTNTLELLEQQAFDLALAYNRDGDADDLSKLERLWQLIHKAKGTSIRERHATVQEQKLALRREELQLKRDVAAARLSSTNGGTRSPSPTSFQSDAINSTNATTHLPNDGKGTFHPCATSTSRGTANPTQAAPADPIDSIQSTEHNLSVSAVPSASLDPEFTASEPSNLRFHRIPGPCPLPDEIVAINRARAIELLSGQIDLGTDEQAVQPTPSNPSTQTTGGLQ